MPDVRAMSQLQHGLMTTSPDITIRRADARDAESIARLARDLVAAGSHVVLVGDLEIDGATTLRTTADSPLESLVTGAVVAELIAVDLARENGVVPGAFAFGSKVTTAL